MTTRDEPHHLVDAIDPAELDQVAAVLRPYAHAQPEGEPPWPRTLGALTGAPADLSSRVDDYLAEGFAS